MKKSLKQRISSVIAVVFLFTSFSSCVPSQEQTRQVSIAALSQNPQSFYRKGRAWYQGGIVVFKKEKKGVHVAVVTEYPFPKMKDKEELSDDQVIAIEMRKKNYDQVMIGSVIDIKGHLRRAEDKGKKIYYIEAGDVRVIRNEKLDDPDFERLVEIVSRRADNDNFFLYTMLFTIIIPNAAFSSGMFFR